MATPVVRVEIDLANGPSFSYPLILDNLSYGILDINTLGDEPADIVDVTDSVMRVSTRRGRNRILANFEAGTATVTINDPNSDFNPQNTASPYYPKLIPLRKIRIYALTTVAGVEQEVNLFAGYINSYDTGFYQGPQQTSTVVLQCVDGFRLLNNVATGTDPIPGCPAGQLSGERVDAILDFAAWPGSQRIRNQGNSTMQADPGGSNRSVLAAIQTVEQSEFGAFFMSRSGKTTFLERDTLSKRAALLPRYYTDSATPTPTQFTYQNLDFAYDDQLILNNVTVTRNADGILPALPQTWDDAVSKSKFFTKSGQRTGLLVENDSESLDQAQTLVAARKNAELRIESLTLSMYSPSTELNTLINLTSDIYDLVFIEKLMPGGSTMQQELFIQGVQHDITPNTWNLKLLTAEPLIQAMILDSATQGILGNTVPQNNNTLSY